ncbi:MAG: hypothetical protein WD530_00900 [Vicingaceae bacterium]
MKTEKDIDKLFREGIQKSYPYDENLWAQVESALPTSSENLAEKSQWRNKLKLLFILAFILFLETDSIVSFNQYVPRQIDESANFSISSASDEALALLTKKAEAPKGKQLESNKKNNNDQKIHSTQKQKEETQSSSSAMKREAISKEKREGETYNRSTNANPVQQKSSSSIEPDEMEDLAQANYADLKLEANVEQSIQSFNSIAEADALPTVSELSRLNSLDFLLESNLSTPMPRGVDKDKLNELQQKFKKRDYFLELEFGRSALINKQLSGLGANMTKYRKEAEKSKFQQSMGINVLTKVKRFTVGLGVHMSSFYEKISYSYNEEVSNINISYDTSYSVVNGNFNSNGTPVILIRENINESRTEVTENVNREFHINNHFKRISLPLSLGYTKTFGRFNVGLRTAVVVSYLYVSSGGYISNNRDNFYAFEEKDQLEDWVIGNRNQLHLGYTLNEFVAIGTSLNHEQDLSSFTQNYNSKFNTYGLGLWLLYRPR